MSKPLAPLALLLATALFACGERSTTALDGAVTGDAADTDGTSTKLDKGVPDVATNTEFGPTPDVALIPDGPPGPDGPFTPNGTCANAQLLALSGGKVTVKGDTTIFANEYGTAISCGSTSVNDIMLGPQQYYKLALKAGQSYLISVTSTFNVANFYIFTGCGATQINKDCGSSGATGALSPDIGNGQTSSMIFKPATAGTYYVAVDGEDANDDGPFTLSIQEYTPPTNTTCAKAKSLTVPAGGKVTEKDTTATSQNEFGTQITCSDTNYNMDGRQLYYKVAMTAGKTYRISWTPSFTYSRLYIFGTTCTAAAINAACGSNGVSGMYSGATSSNTLNMRTFKPSTSGTYTIAVDSRIASYYGVFTLEIEDWTPNNKCAAPKALTLSGGKVTVQDSTTGAANEFGNQIDCGGTGNNSDFDGNQVYYSVSLTAGATYKVTLAPSFYARLYLFGSTCTPATINANCGSAGVSGDYTSSTVYPNNTGGFVFKPATSGTYKIAVDSTGTNSNYHGAFTLSVETWTPPTNTTCAKAKSLTLSGGKVTTTGDTTGAPNEFGTSVNCDFGYTGALDGPQVYYSVALTKGKVYRVRLTPSFLARYYIFGNTCTPAQIDAACKTNGASGDAANVSSGSTGTIVFSPPASGTYKIAVDSQAAVYYGSFSLSLEEWTPPTNSTCAGAQTVTLSGGGATVSGDTTNVPNEFGTAINCGSFSLNDILLGSQLYYKVALTANTTYTFTFTPYYSYARLYIFTDTCTFSTINSDCGSVGKTGLITSTASSGSPVNVTFTPTTSGTYKFAVDATRTYTSADGPFTVTIK
jgi:hypothetical protein